MKIDTAEPFVTTTTAGKFADVRGFPRMQACMDKHVRSFCKRLAALRARVKSTRLTNS